MTSLSTVARSTALLLLVAAVACGDGITDFDAKAARQSAASPNEKEPDATAFVVPPVWTLQTKLGTSSDVIQHMPPGFAPPPGQYYGYDARATGFTPGKSFDFRTLGRFVDSGEIFYIGGGGGGVVPADGSFRTAGGGDCPSRFSEIWVVVHTNWREWESPHFVPLC